VERFAEEINRIIDIAKKHTDKVLLVGMQAVDESKTTPIAWADMHFTNKRIAEFEAEARRVAREKRVDFVAVHSEMLKNGEPLQAADGLHPNDAGHKLIFELVRPALAELLNT
jgi:lysophospholipase L1-like esterase